MVTPETVKNHPIMIAIAGPSGAGKSTLVRAVAALLDDATTVFFDDYGASSTYPSDLKIWLDSGAHSEEWRTPDFAAALAKLCAGDSVIHPDGITTLQPTRFIVIEEPFGRERPEVASLIDMVIFIDLPLEIAFARKLRQYIAWAAERETADEVVAGCDAFLQSYLESIRDVYVIVGEQARASSDLQVDGTLEATTLASTIAQDIRTRYH